MPPTNDQVRALQNKGIPYGIAKTAVDITQLNHTALTGAVDDTLADITTVDAALEADIKKLASKVNQIIVALENSGITL